MLPSGNNVYGYLYSKIGLIPVAKVLRTYLGATQNQVFVDKSQFDGKETLKIRLKTCELETQSLDKDKWLFNGAVAGDPDSIRVTLQTLSDPLRSAGFDTSFEIYDQNCDLVFYYP